MENETTVVNQNLQANASKPFHNTVLTTNKHGARASRKREKSEIKTICTQENQSACYLEIIMKLVRP